MYGHRRVGSGVGSTVNGEIGSGDVGGLRAGDEGYQGGNLVDSAVAFERCDSYLGCCPVACSRIEIGVDGPGLDVIDCDAAAAASRARPWVNIFTAPLVAE